MQRLSKAVAVNRAELGKILEVLVLEYYFISTRTRTCTRRIGTRTRTRTRRIGTRTRTRTRRLGTRTQRISTRDFCNIFYRKSITNASVVFPKNYLIFHS